MNKTYSQMLCRTIVLSTILMAGSASAGDGSDAALLLSCGEVAGNIYTVDAAGPQPSAVNDASFLTAAVVDMGYAYDDAAGTLNQANATQVTLKGGDAQAKNICWQVAAATTLETCAF